MKDLPIRNIFLPAALVGASIFSSLAFALPTFLNQDAGAGWPGPRQWQSRSTLTGLHKEVVISYVGTAIMLSAGASLGTAEVLRRRTKAAQQPQDFKSALAEFVDQQAQQESPDMETQFSSLVAAYAHADSLAAASAVEAIDTSTDEAMEVHWPTVAVTAATVEACSEQAMAEEIDNTVIFPGQYRRCRVQVPGSQQQQYAIAFNDQFYSLLSSGMAKEQALATVKRLEQEQQAAILTPMNQGYAVWVAEPAAELVAVA
ncbi:MAG: hypothetical protein AAF892_02155 [Cyanobacteria bacterium P01_D01_bin.71]